MNKKSCRRTDYWDDPKAPAPTSRKPSASVVLRNHRAELVRCAARALGYGPSRPARSKKKETLTACAVRECRE